MSILKNIALLTPVFLMMILNNGCPRLQPAQGASNPLFLGVALDGYPIQRERLIKTGQDIGISPQIVVFFLQWPSPNTQITGVFPRGSLDAIWDSGAIPCLTWEPMYHHKGQEVMVPYRKILDGTYDSYLLRFAEQANVWNKPFMIRFAHEMNIERYHWGTDKAGYGPESPRIYHRMFRYVVSLFRKVGARNVLWVFCPNSESVPHVSYDSKAAWNRIEAYYPGDTYVDVLGMDGYNWGTTQTKAKNGWNSHWRDFASIFHPAWETLKQMAPDKPIMVFETASVDQGGDKTQWIRKAFATARDWHLNGLVWFQVDKEYDWRMNSGGKVPGTAIPKATPCSPHQWIRGLRYE